MSTVSEILRKYKKTDKFLGYSATACFEAELVGVIEKNGATFAEFKKIVTFLHNNDFDDSSTGMAYIYDALNGVLKEELETPNRVKDWQWLKENCFADDRFMETILPAYTDDRYRAEMRELLDNKDRSAWLNFGSYYKALYMKLTGDSALEEYLDAHMISADMKRMKMELLLARGEKTKAFDLIKDEPDLVPEAAELTEDKEGYLLDNILNGRERYDGQKEHWWDMLCEIAGDKYLPEILSSPYICEMANKELYKAERYDELIERINSGLIYDGGRLNNDESAKYHAVQSFKKLKKIYPEWCAGIMIDYAVLMISEGKNRNHYRKSAQTLVRAGKLGEKCRAMAEKAGIELAEKYPKKTAMLEELRDAGLI